MRRFPPAASHGAVDHSKYEWVRGFRVVCGTNTLRSLEFLLRGGLAYFGQYHFLGATGPTAGRQEITGSIG